MSQKTPTSLVDLTNCDREPIHIPGSIQPHGVLLVLREPELVIIQVSESCAVHLGRRAEELLGVALSDVIEQESAEAVRAALAQPRPTDENPLVIIAQGARFDGIVHRHDGVAMLELEPPPAPDSDSPGHASLRMVLGELQRCDDVAALCENVVRMVRRITGFQRVMLYRFSEDGNGSVVAECKADELPPYLGLHYPASDIPRQARELYLRNWLRLIPDARYTPSPILPPACPDTGAALDLSHSVLRSVSPIHLEYLANMGARAAMSISLVVGERLWGLVACQNHSGPRFVRHEVRLVCEAIGQLMSLQIPALEERERVEERARRRPLHEALADAMRGTPEDADVLEALVTRPDVLLALVSADGAAILGAGSPHTCGQVPPEPLLFELGRWLDGRGEFEPFATHALASCFADAAGAKDVASGLLSVVLPGMPRRRIMWFRPEITKTVFWGGDPREPVQADPHARLHPRRSFEKWKEEVRLSARPWRVGDVEAAAELRRSAIEIDLARQLALAQRAVRARDEVVAVVSHDLKNPLLVIQIEIARLLRSTAQENDELTRRLRDTGERIQCVLKRMDALITTLLDLDKIKAGRFDVKPRQTQLRDLIDQALASVRPLAEARHIALTCEDLDSCVLRVDRGRMLQVLTNILGNAIKFTPHGGQITVEARRAADELWISIADTGPGIPEEQMKHVFERYWRAPGSRRTAGSGLGLYISKGIVEAHGGRIWVERAKKGGARFTFTIPCKE
jgi:light-regulated signal transduction histidine kinase (bacteriophytochrome)